MPVRVPSEPAAIVAAGYHQLAPHWTEWADGVRPPLRMAYVEELLERLPEAAAVVELGCGTGLPVGAALAARSRYHGVDGAAGMIGAARANVPGGSFRHADMRTVEFDEGALNAVVALHSILHVPREEHAAIFAKVRGWLRPGGWFVASLGARDDPGSGEESWLGAGPMFWSGFAPAENERLLRAAGFSLVESDVRQQWEGAEEVRFHWVVCRAGGDDGTGG